MKPQIPMADADDFPEPHMERQEPLPPPFTAEEHLQTVQSAWNGLTVSLAIVCAIMFGVLVVHAAARAGWLP